MKRYLLFASAVLTGLSLVFAQTLSNPFQSKLTAAETQPVTIRFQAQVGDRPFQCGESYSLGRPAKMMTPMDFRFYVSDIALIDVNGKAVPLQLEQDGKWQYKSVALLDFENKSAACSNGTEDVRDRVVGTVAPGTYKGIRFSLGVPFALNHADATLATSPLNLTSLWWNWRGGYKFLRIDLMDAGMSMSQGTSEQSLSNHGAESAHGSAGHSSHAVQGFAIHLGSTACQARMTTQPPTSCANPNQAEIVLKNFNPAQNVVIVDLAALVASTNLGMNQPSTAAGCMSEPGDRDCLGIMASVGVSFGGQSPRGQTFFRVK